MLEINKDKQEISLGMKQIEENPWERVAEKYPPGSVVEGKVRNIANYGAFVEIEEGIDGLLHVSRPVLDQEDRPSLEKSQEGRRGQVRRARRRSGEAAHRAGPQADHEDPWLHAIPDAYRPGMVVQGTVTKITNFGVFVELEPDLEGLLHISEISDQKVENPQDVVKVGEEVEVKILRVDSDERKIGLSLKRAQWGDTTGPRSAGGEAPRAGSGEQRRRSAGRQAARKKPSRGGMDDHGALGTDKIKM